jgi:signal transduction histidine kinase
LERITGLVKNRHQGRDYQIEYRLLRADKKTIWVRDSARVRAIKGSQSYFIYGVVSDITHQKRIEQKLETQTQRLEEIVNKRTEKLSELVASQKQFSSTISHEIRNPLALIKAVIESQLEQEDHPVSLTREEIQLINDKVDQITNIIRNLTTISRIEFGQLSPNYTKINLCNFLKRTINHITQTSKTKVKITQNCDPVLEISTDVSILESILTNILENALTHAPKPPSITITAEIDPKSQIAHLIITDSNPAIPKSIHEKIFEKAYRNNPNVSGSGLGLYLCRELITMLDGKIWVTSTEPAGNSFHLELRQ